MADNVISYKNFKRNAQKNRSKQGCFAIKKKIGMLSAIFWVYAPKNFPIENFRVRID